MFVSRSEIENTGKITLSRFLSSNGEDGGGDDVDDDEYDVVLDVGAYMWWYGVLCILTHAICFIFVQLRTFQFVFIMLPILHGHAPPKPSVVVLI